MNLVFHKCRKSRHSGRHALVTRVCSDLLRCYGVDHSNMHTMVCCAFQLFTTYIGPELYTFLVSAYGCPVVFQKCHHLRSRRPEMIRKRIEIRPQAEAVEIDQSV